MRPVTRKMFRILNNEKFMPVMFLEIKPLGTSDDNIQRFTDYGTDCAWAGQEYRAVVMKRGTLREIVSSESGEYADTEISVANIDGALAEVLNRIELAGAKATLYMADRRLLARKRDAMLLTTGEIREPVINSRVLTFQIVSILGMTDRIQVPRRLWQQECNYTFGSRACGINIDKAPWSLTGEVQAGSTEEFIVVANSVIADAGSPPKPSEFWENGYILLTDGDCAPEARPISYVDTSQGGYRFYLSRSFYAAPTAGDSFILRRGCGKTKADCKERNNLLNYGGFEEVPYERRKPSIRED
jgi:phage-related protein